MKSLIKKTLIICFLISIQGSTFVIDASKNAVMHNNKGLDFMHLDRYDLAIQEFKLAIMLNPDAAVSASFYNNLGLTYLKIEKYDWAESCFDKAIGINPNFFEYYRNLAESYKLNKDLAKRFLDYRNLLDKNDNNSAAWLMCGLIQYEMGNLRSASDYLNKFIILESDLVLTDAVRKFTDEIEKTIKKDRK